MRHRGEENAQKVREILNTCLPKTEYREKSHKAYVELMLGKPVASLASLPVDDGRGLVRAAKTLAGVA